MEILKDINIEKKLFQKMNEIWNFFQQDKSFTLKAYLTDKQLHLFSEMLDDLANKIFKPLGIITKLSNIKFSKALKHSKEPSNGNQAEDRKLRQFNKQIVDNYVIIQSLINEERKYWYSQEVQPKLNMKHLIIEIQSKHKILFNKEVKIEMKKLKTQILEYLAVKFLIIEKSQINDRALFFIERFFPYIAILSNFLFMNFKDYKQKGFLQNKIQSEMARLKSCEHNTLYVQKKCNKFQSQLKYRSLKWQSEMIDSEKQQLYNEIIQEYKTLMQNMLSLINQNKSLKAGKRTKYYTNEIQEKNVFQYQIKRQKMSPESSQSSYNVFSTNSSLNFSLQGDYEEEKEHSDSSQLGYQEYVSSSEVSTNEDSQFTVDFELSSLLLGNRYIQFHDQFLIDYSYNSQSLAKSCFGYWDEDFNCYLKKPIKLIQESKQNFININLQLVQQKKSQIFCININTQSTTFKNIIMDERILQKWGIDDTRIEYIILTRNGESLGYDNLDVSLQQLNIQNQELILIDFILRGSSEQSSLNLSFDSTLTKCYSQDRTLTKSKSMYDIPITYLELEFNINQDTISQQNVQRLIFEQKLVEIHYPHISQMITDCRQEITNHLQTMFTECQSKLNRHMSINNELTIKDLEDFWDSFKTSKFVENLLNTLLDSQTIDSSLYLFEIKTQLDKLYSKIQQQNGLSIYELKINLDKIELISSQFPQYKSFYETAKDFSLQIVVDTQRAFEQNLSSNMIEQSADKLKEILTLNGQLKDHLQDKIENIIEQLQKNIKKHLSSFNSEVNELINNISENNALKLQELLNIIEQVKINYPEQIIERQVINQIYEDCIQNIMQRTFDIYEIISNILNQQQESQFVDIKPFIKQLKFFNEIQCISHKIAEKYHKIISEIMGNILNLNRDVDHILKQILSNTEGANFQQLQKNLLILQNASWIEEYSPQTFSQSQTDIKDQLLSYAKSLQDGIFRYQVDIENSQYIPLISQKLKQLNEMESLSKQVEGLQIIIDSSNKIFISSVFSILEIIQKNFNLEKIQQSIAQILDYQKAENAVNFLRILKDQNLNVNNINNEVSKSFTEFQDFLKEYSLLIIQNLKSAFTILEDNNSKREDFLKAIQELSERMQEIQKIKEYKSLNLVLFQNQDKSELLEQQKLKILKIQSIYDNDISMSLGSKDLNKCTKILDRIKYMSDLDQFLGKKSFLDMYKSCQNQLINNDTPLMFKDCCNSLIQYDYSSVASILPNFDIETNPVMVKNFNELKRQLDSHVEQLLSKTINSTRYFFQLMENDEQHFSERLEFLETSIKRIDTVTQILASYLNPSQIENMLKCKEKLKSIISEGLKEFIQNLEGYIKTTNLFEAGKHSRKINTICDSLGENCEESVVEIVRQQKQKLIKELNKLVELFKEETFFFIRKKQPKEIFKKLEMDQGNQYYIGTLQQLTEIITQKFGEELIKESTNTNGISKARNLKRLEQYLIFLPVQLKEQLEQDLQQEIKDTAALEESQNQELQAAIEQNNFELINAAYNENMTCGKQNQQTQLIKAAIYQKASLYKTNIQVNCKEKDFDELIYNIEEFKTFMDLLKTNFEREISKEYQQIKKDFQFIFKQEIDIFDRQFKVNLKTQNSEAQISSALNRSFDSQITNDYYEEDTCEIKTFQILLNFSYKSSILVKDLCPQSEDIVNKSLKKICGFFQELNILFQEGFKDQDMKKLCVVLKNSKQKDQILLHFKDELETFRSYDLIYFVEIIESTYTYSQMVTVILDKAIKSQQFLLNVDLISSTKGLVQKERQEYMFDCNRQLQEVKVLKSLSKYISSNVVDLNTIGLECQNEIDNKIQQISQHTAEIINKEKFDINDCKEFSSNYNIFKDIIVFFDVQKDKFINEKQNIDKQLKTKVLSIESQAKQNTKLEDITGCLLEMQIMSENIPEFADDINKNITNVLVNCKRMPQGSQVIAKLGVILKESQMGKNILQDQSIFEGFNIALFAGETQKHGIEYVLSNIEGDSINKDKLKARYDEFIKIYQKQVEQYLKPDCKFDDLIAHIKALCKKQTYKGLKIDWGNQIYASFSAILANIFTLWTLQNATHYFDAVGLDDQDNYLLKPHAAQIIAIFRLLGLGDDSQKMQNNLVQVGTGEGKSIILGITSVFLALFNIKVRCACYSEYLSIRDYDSFLQLFEALDLVPLIKYGTFNNLCEQVINEKGNIRETILNVVSTNKFNFVANYNKVQPQILLIDEVDVFFSKDFYGNVYTPSATLNDQQIKDLLAYIWTQRKSLSYDNIILSKQFKDCCDKYSGWDQLFQEVIKDIVSDIKDYENHQYTIHNNQIGYKEQDKIECNVKYGYKTLFAYYHEHANGKITEESLVANKTIQIKCGNFSYAAIPLQFQNILGVTGTLKTLSQPEQDVVENQYKILRKTYTPSVFGKNQLTFIENQDTLVELEHDYYNAIVQAIKNRLEGKTPGTKRAVIVCFESKELLEIFYNSEQFSKFKENSIKLTEAASSVEKKRIVRQAVSSGQITLITRAFGRGTDFQDTDPNVWSNGGIHVIMAFLSEQVSEEIQIKGRTARQGKQGSFSIIVQENDLEKFLITKEDLANNKGAIYNILNKRRNEFFNAQYESNKEYIKTVDANHTKSQALLSQLYGSELGKLRESLVYFNLGVPIIMIKQSKTVVLMDATGSMGGLIQKAKNTVQTMFERAGVVLESNGFTEGSFKLQFAVFRSYSSREDEILESSPWETKADSLRKFMERITAKGGTGPGEAVEIGLWHANNENSLEYISQVILIGDAPSNTASETIMHRSSYHGGEEYWKKTKFGPPTSDVLEIQKFKAAGIKVHAFYVNDYAKNSYISIANGTGGTHKLLDVNSPTGAELLTDLVTQEILRNVAQQNGKDGEAIVQQYRAKFGKTHA